MASSVVNIKRKRDMYEENNPLKESKLAKTLLRIDILHKCFTVFC